ncbi:MAG TPA: cyclase family protein, partial [Candidatus Binatia bacterium]
MPAYAIDDKKLVDLTYPFSAETMHWPTAKPFHLEKVSEGRTADGYWFSSYNYSGSEHVGTHLDAPFHFAEGKWTTDQIPLGRTIGPGVVIDTRRRTDKNRDYLLAVEDVHAWEKVHGRLPAGAIVLIHTGWRKYWGDRKRYFGT